MSSPLVLLRFLLLRILIPLSVLSTTWLYLYPIFHLCAFPSPPTSNLHSPFLNTLAQHFHLTLSNDDTAPFRLLVFGDPQLEGDTSLPAGGLLNFPSLKGILGLVRDVEGVKGKGEVVGRQLSKFLAEDVVRAVVAARKTLDLWGNDFYLAHIYRTMRWWTRPTHVAVLGDLLGSQWISDEEFKVRGDRFWNRVFRGGRRVGDDTTMGVVGGGAEVLGEDEAWGRRVVCVVGNHDVGYAGDMTEERAERFERVFGGMNWDIRFQLQGTVHNTTTPPPSIHLITLNSLNLDTPALSAHLQNKTYAFLNQILSTTPPKSKTDFTILLTHLPLHKPAGVCADPPFFDFHGQEYGGGVREQNHLSEASSKVLLEAVFGMRSPAVAGEGARNGIILTGHDHEGCDVYHYPSTSSPSSPHPYNTTNATTTAPPTPDSLREITVRSMMGDYGGSAGLLSAWFSRQKGEWEYSYQDCRAGVQHWWWGVHGLDFVTVVWWAVVWMAGGLVREGKRTRRRGGVRKGGKRKRRKAG
ncbi:hypothetical protein FGG08_004456 [Glutinoglossum americanum]|uniref:Calcineurin-like phosphoesterase domain-containing protein n=1 Tax=Glutinoglossum americanum TaxID=1670608 RepID=A0A9P8I0M6_9PEZI|nr:hypothetical protein FGG08_004456 [Glutinoglossum americanum]